MEIDISERDLYWLAGLLEGEGCFLADNSGKGKPSIALAMTDEDVIARASALLGVSYGPSRSHPGVNGFASREQSYVVRPSGRRAVLWMRKLYPLMGERRQRAILKAIYTFEDRSWTQAQLRQWSHADRSAVVEMLANGLNYHEVVAALDGRVSRSTIAKFARAHGLTSGYRTRGSRAA